MENEKRYLIVGLGNAEQQYAGTRHNYGFEVANAVAKAFNVNFTVDRLAYVARANFKGRELVIIMPTTYMNLSGKAVKYWLTEENVSVDHCLVIYDDIDLPLGIFKLKPKGGGGTQLRPRLPGRLRAGPFLHRGAQARGFLRQTGRQRREIVRHRGHAAHHEPVQHERDGVGEDHRGSRQKTRGSGLTYTILFQEGCRPDMCQPRAQPWDNKTTKQ